jgi:hypothetical protein
MSGINSISNLKSSSISNSSRPNPQSASQNQQRASTMPPALASNLKQPPANASAIGNEQLPHWTSDEIDRRLTESAKLLEEWTKLMDTTG